LFAVATSLSLIQTPKMTVKYACQKYFKPDTKINDFDAKVYDACMRIPVGMKHVYNSTVKLTNF
jgi:hypothetical protein